MRPDLLLVQKVLRKKPTLILIDQAIVSLSSFIWMAILGRERGTEELGIYGLAFITLWLLTSFANSVAWSPFTAKSPGFGPRRTKSESSSITLHVLGIAGLMSIPAIGFTIYYGGAPIFTFLSIWIFFAGMILREHSRRSSMALQKFKTLLILDTVSSIGTLIILLLLAHFDLVSARLMMLVIGIMGSIAFLYFAVQISFSIPTTKIVVFVFRRNWTLGRWLVGVSALGSISDFTTRMLIASLLGLDMQGLFTASLAVPYFSNPIFLTAGNYLRIIFAKSYVDSGAEHLYRLYFKGCAGFLIAGISIFGTIALIGEPLATTIFGPEFEGLGGMIALNCMAIQVSTMIFVSEAVLTTLGFGRKQFIGSATKLCLVLLFGPPLIYYFKLPGASITLAIGYGAEFLVQNAFILSLARNPISSFSKPTQLELAK